MPEFNDPFSFKGEEVEKESMTDPFSFGKTEEPSKKKDGTTLEVLPLDGGKKKTDGQLPSPKEVISKDKLDEEVFNDYFKSIGVASPINKKKVLDSLLAEKIPYKQAAEQAGFEYKVVAEGNQQKEIIDFTQEDKEAIKKASTDLSGTYKTRATDIIDKKINTLSGQYIRFDGKQNEEVFGNIKELLKYKAINFPNAVKTKEDVDKSVSDLDQMLDMFTLKSLMDVSSAQAEVADSPYPAPGGFKSLQTRMGEVSKAISIKEDNLTIGANERSNVLAARSTAKAASEMMRQSKSNIATEAGVAFGTHFTDLLNIENDIANNKVVSKAIDDLNNKFVAIEQGKMSVYDLTPSEIMLSKSLEALGGVQNTYGKEISLSTEAGAVIGNSAAFALEMFATGGIGTGVRSATTSAILQGSKTLMPTVARAAAAETMGLLTQAGVRTLAMPSFAKGVADNYSKGLSIPTSIVDGYYNTFKEVASESLFGTTIKQGSKIVNQSAIRKFFYRTNSALGNVYDVKSGIKAYGEELTEEVFVGVLDGYEKSMKESGNTFDISGVGDYLTNYHDLVLTAYSIGVMSAVGGGANIASNTAMKIQNKGYAKKLGDLTNDINNIIDPSSEGFQSMTPTEMVNNVTMFASEYAKVNGLKKEDAIDIVKTAHKYAINQIALNEISSPKLGSSRPVIFEGDLMEPSESVEGKPQKSDINFSIVTTEENKEEITLGSKLTSVMDNINNGVEMHADQLDEALFILDDMLQQSKSENNKEIIQEYIDDIKDILTDGNPAEINTKPRFSHVQRDVFVKTEGAKSRIYEATLKGDKLGYVQEDVVNGVPQYHVIDNNGGVIATTNTDVEAYAIITSPEQTKEAKRQTVQSTLSEFTENIQNPSQFVVVGSMEDIENALEGETDEVKKEILSGGTMVSYYSPKTDRIYVVSDQMPQTREEQFAIFAHEQLLHKGLNMMIPNSAQRAIFLKQIHDTVGREEILKVVGEDYASSPDHVLANEYLASIAEDIMNEKDLTPQQKTAWDKFLTLFKNLVLRVFGRNVNFTTEELHSLIRASAQEVIGYVEDTDYTSEGDVDTDMVIRRGGEQGNGEVLPMRDRLGGDATLSQGVEAILSEAINSSVDILPVHHATATEFSDFSDEYFGGATSEKAHGEGHYTGTIWDRISRYAGKAAAEMGLYNSYAESIRNTLGEDAATEFLYRMKQTGSEEKIIKEDKYGLGSYLLSNPLPKVRVRLDIKAFKNKLDGGFNHLHWTKPVSEEQKTAIRNAAKGLPNEKEIVKVVDEAENGSDIVKGLGGRFSGGTKLKEGVFEGADSETKTRLFLQQAGIDGVLAPKKEGSDYVTFFDKNQLAIESVGYFRRLKKGAKSLDEIKRSEALKSVKEIRKARKGKPIVISDIQALKNQLRSERRGGLEHKKAIKDLVDKLNEDVGGSVITVKQHSNIMKRLSNLNINSSVAIEKFIAYVEKVYEKADRLAKTQALKNQLRSERMGGLRQKKAVKDLITKLNEDVGRGVITVKQHSNIMKRLSNLNMNNSVAIEKFIAYAEKIYEKADMADKISNAQKIRKSIKKTASKNGTEVGLFAKQFTDIDPVFVDNIDEYIEVAKVVKEGLVKTKIGVETDKATKDKRLKLKTSDVLNIDQLSPYVESKMAAQNKILEAANEKNMSSISEGLKTKEEIKEEAKINKEKVMSDIATVFAYNLDTVKKMAETNIDPNTGEQLDLSEEEKKTALLFASIDPYELEVGEALSAIDAINNFITNGSTMGMKGTIQYVNGRRAVKALKKSGVISKKYISPYNIASAFYSEGMATLPVYFMNIFRGQEAMEQFMSLSGLRGIINGASKAQKKTNDVIDEYTNTYEKTKPNGKDFMDVANVVERGIYAHLLRNEISTEAEQEALFIHRLNQLDQSINNMSKSKEQEDLDKAAVYREVFDDLKSRAEQNMKKEGRLDLRIDDFNSVVNETNKKAVNFWIDKWSEIFPELRDLAYDVYGKVIIGGANYTTDKHKRLRGVGPETIDEYNTMAFESSTQSVYDKSANVLKDKKRLAMFNPDSYVSLDFDSNQGGAMKSALIDLYTAEATKKLKGFVESPEYSSIFPDSKTKEIATRRIAQYVKAKRAKVFYDKTEIDSIRKGLERVIKIGARQSLAGVSQWVKQTAPIVGNTIVNTGSFNLVEYMNNEAIKKLIDESGRPIAIRGASSSIPIEDFNKIVAKSKGFKGFVDAIDKLQEKQLEALLVKPDIIFAKASWFTYYNYDLKRQGIDVDNIDWNTHKLNDKAADYAQDMVDFQQNVSDSDLLGTLFNPASKDKWVLRQLLLVFASFTTNMKARIWTDIAILNSKQASTQEKGRATRSLIGTLAESAVFNTVSTMVRWSMRMTALAIASSMSGVKGDDDDEELMKKARMDANMGITNMTADFVSPFTTFDKPTINSINKIYSAITGNDEEDLLYYNDKYDATTQWGTMGLAFSHYEYLQDLIKIVATGEVESDFYGHKTKKYIPEQYNDLLVTSLTAYSLYALLGLPNEAASIARNLKNIAVKQSETKTQIEKRKAKGNEDKIKRGSDRKGREDRIKREP